MKLSLPSIVATFSKITPRRQIKFLIDEAKFTAWEAYRDSLVRRWANLNVVCGLILSAASAVLFSNFNAGRFAFAMAVVSLLSSLISIGFGVGLTYVLGDVQGATFHAIAIVHSRLFTFALAIPQVWAGVSFVAFFASTCAIVWDSGKGPFVKAGVCVAVAFLFLHTVGFAYLLRDNDVDHIDPAISNPQTPSPYSETEPQKPEPSQRGAIGGSTSSRDVRVTTVSHDDKCAVIT